MCTERSSAVTERVLLQGAPPFLRPLLSHPSTEAAYDVMFLLLIEQPPLLLFYIFFPSPSDLLLLPLLLSLAVIVVVDACVRCRFSCIPGHLSGSLQSFFSSVTTRPRATPTEHCKTLSSADKR